MCMMFAHCGATTIPGRALKKGNCHLKNGAFVLSSWHPLQASCLDNPTVNEGRLRLQPASFCTSIMRSKVRRQPGRAQSCAISRMIGKMHYGRDAAGLCTHRCHRF